MGHTIAGYDRTASLKDFEVGVGGTEITPALENAALLHAHGQTAAARRLLGSSVKSDPETQGSSFAWLGLLDLLQRLGEREEFDRVGLDYATRFEVSPPTWEGAVGPGQASSERLGSGYIGLPAHFSGHDLSPVQRLVRAAEVHAQLRLDVGTVRQIEESACAALSAELGRLRRAGYPVVWIGVGALRTLLEERVIAGSPTGEGYWLLLLELLQSEGKQGEFESRAIDYAVTFEVSPPSWEPPAAARRAVRAPAAQGIAEVPAEEDALALQGSLAGAADPQLKALEGRLAGREAVLLDMREVQRIDFIAAGSLLNALAAAAQRGTRVYLSGTSPILQALLLTIGADPSHFRRRAS